MNDMCKLIIKELIIKPILGYIAGSILGVLCGLAAGGRL